MKDLRHLFLFSFIALGFLVFSCDDSGTLPPNIPSGTTYLNLLNLKPLNQSTDGMYQLWIRITDTTTGGFYHKNMGKFNILDNGNLVDSAGNSFNITFGTDTLVIPLARYALVTIEQPGTYSPNPGPACLLAGPLTIYRDSLSAALVLTDSLALGAPGSMLMSIDHAYYMIKTTTNPNLGCVRGIWFSDTLNVQSIPNSVNLPNGGGWIYEGWVVDNSVNTYYSTGKFYQTDAPDQDGAGSCSGPNAPAYNKPGQEWTIDSCSSLTNIRSGTCGVFITFEPSWRNASTPFFLKPFEQTIIDHTLGCGQDDNLFSRRGYLPYGRIRIAR